MRRRVLQVTLVALGLATGPTMPSSQAEAKGGNTVNSLQFVCLHHPADPKLCAPTWMHTCWCEVGET